MKLHLCCGDIYLDGYINCDLDGIIYEPELMSIESNITTLDKYYKYPFIEDEKLRQKNRRDIIIDRRVNLLEKWPFDNNSVEEIVLINAIEHFTKQDFKHIRQEIERVSQLGCKILLSFPNILDTVVKYYHDNFDHCMDLIYCNWKNQYSVHKTGYCPELIAFLFNNWSFQIVNIINHDYPNYQMEGTKLYGSTVQ